MVNRNLRIIGIYLFGTICLLGYLWMDNSTELHEFLEKAKRTREDWKFGAFAIIGLTKFVLLITSISVFAIMTFLLVKRTLQQRTDKT